MDHLNAWVRRAEQQHIGRRAAYLAAVNQGASPQRAVQLAEQAMAEGRAQAARAVLAGRVTTEEHFRAYVRRAAVHRVNDEMRRTRRWRQLGDEAPPPTVSEGAGADGLPELIQTALAELDRPSRFLVRLYHFDGFRLQDLAELQGVSVATMHRRLAQARVRMGEVLVRLGVQL